MEGFVEMHDGTKWGAVCGDGWGIEEVVVTCRQLDLGFGLKAVAGKYNFGMSTVKIEYSHLDCAVSRRREWVTFAGKRFKVYIFIVVIDGDDDGGWG